MCNLSHEKLTGGLNITMHIVTTALGESYWFSLRISDAVHALLTDSEVKSFPNLPNMIISYFAWMISFKFCNCQFISRNNGRPLYRRLKLPYGTGT